MDDRQRGIEIGAGLQESRLNEDFIQWLQKWGPRLLYTLAIVVGLYAANKYYQQWQADKTDMAFKELSDARGALMGATYAGSPDALLAIAEKYPSRASIAIQARLDAADIYATAARRGVFPGGDYNKPEDRLNAEQMKQQNERAKALYEEVIAEVRGKARLAPFALDAHEGLFTVLLNLNELPEARRIGQAALELAEEGRLTGRAGIMRKRLEGIDGLGKLAALPSDAELPESAKMKTPQTPAALTMPGDDGLVGPSSDLAPMIEAGEDAAEKPAVDGDGATQPGTSGDDAPMP